MTVSNRDPDFKVTILFNIR